MIKPLDNRISEEALARLARIETECGDWHEYSNDGQLATSPRDKTWAGSAGTGCRARFADNPHGEDYGWGPLAETEMGAIVLLLADELDLTWAELKIAEAELEALKA